MLCYNGTSIIGYSNSKPFKFGVGRCDTSTESRTIRRKNVKKLVKINGYKLCHINVTIRREMGRDINGACGQLRKSYMGSQET